MAFINIPMGRGNDPDYVKVVEANEHMRKAIGKALHLIATKRALGAAETAEIKVLLKEATKI